MSVQTRNKQYTHKEYEWRQLRDTADGMSSVKRSGTLYLPMPNAMSSSNQPPAGVQGSSNDDDKSVSDNAPWKHSNAAYSAYCQRAKFPDIVSVCLRGLVGIATKIDPVVELPKSMEYLLEDATGTNIGLFKLFEKIISENILVGRNELFVDIDINADESSRLKFVNYRAEDFINWKTQKDGSLILAVFKEETLDDENDEFSDDTVESNLVQRLQFTDESPDTLVYTTQFYKDGEPGEIKTPSFMGTTLEFIPTVVINSIGVGSQVVSSPMIGISDISISIYQKDADMSSSEFMTCNAMLVTSGIDNEDIPTVIGSQVSWNLPNESAKAYYVEPQSNCLSHMDNRIQNLFDEAVRYGVALLGPNKKGVESAETVRLQQAASGATLQTVVEATGEGIEQGLKIMAAWMGENPDLVTFTPNMEFSESTLTPQEQTALLQAWLNKAISYETYFGNMQEAGIIDSETTLEEEQGRIEIAGPILDAEDVTTGIKPGVSSTGGSEEEGDVE